MKCPLLMMVNPYLNRQVGNSGSNCLQVECAWWDPDVEGCIIQSIDNRLGDIAHWLQGGKTDDNRKI
ncbi:MAG: hypothetical protein A2Y89_06680 [Chloroflexi bacterium RBG_13_51_18]|nr:MAG: hypothetical protein A2Y89_06680 [Chloroflexi bacterium RBG_13_51_18]